MKTDDTKIADAGERKSASAADADKFLTFFLDRERYGVTIMAVSEIIGLLNITAVPETARFVRGVINLRGKVFPVIDLRERLMLPRVPDTAETCIVVTEVAQTAIGVIVDRVSDVADIPRELIEPPPVMEGATDGLLRGIAKLPDGNVLLLDPEKALLGEPFTVFGKRDE